MARRYESSLAVSTPGVEFASSQASQELANTLSSFSRTIGGIASRAQTKKGATAGAAVEGTPSLRSNATAYGRAYNNAALRNYVIGHYTTAEQEIARIELEAGSDPAKFRALADGVRKGALSGAIPEAKGDVSEMYQRRIAEGLVRIEQRRATEQRALNKAVLQQGLDTVADSISRKLASGDHEQMQQAIDEELQYGLMIDGAVTSGDITEAEGVVLRGQAQKRVTGQVIMGQFEREIRQGDPVAFIGKVMTQPVEDLADEEKQQLVGALFERLNRYQSLIAEDEQTSNADQKARWAEGERTATVAVLRRSTTLDELARMVENDELDPSVGRTLANELSAPTRAIDDEALKFQVETNLLAYEEADIASMGGLSHATRSDLILKRREQADGWRNDQAAQEAIRRIDVALGIPAGLGPQFQIAIGPEDAKAASSARSYFYDLVEATPEEERKAKYFELADEAITRMRVDLASADLAKARTSLQQYQAEVGSPADMNERERKEYDEMVKLYTDQISKAEAAGAR